MASSQRRTNTEKEREVLEACRRGNIAGVRRLAREVELTRVKDSSDYDQSPLHWAALYGQLEVVEYLLGEVKFDANIKDSLGLTPLHWACMHGKLSVVRFLVGEGKADCHARTNADSTPLHVASSSGHLEAVECLIRQRCNVNSKNNTGWTPLHDACWFDHTHVVEALLVAGANPNSVDDYGETPLDRTDSSGCIRLLLAYNADPNSIYKACKKYLPSSCPRTPEKPSVKVFIVGDSGAGKSTLTESLKKDISGLSGLLARVSPVSAEKKTAGIMPHKISSSTMGSFQVYDLAGDKEFYSSHDAVITTSLSGSSSAVFLLVVDLRPAAEDISHTLHYWMSFLESKLLEDCSKPHLIIVGSHFDEIVQSEFTMKIKVITLAQERAKTCGFDVKGVIAMNCLIAMSDGMMKLRRTLYASYKLLQPQTAMTFRNHCFHILLVSLSKGKHAIQFRTVLESCQKQPDNYVYQFLPNTSEGLWALCDDLSKQNLILIFKNEKTLEKTWMIIDQAALLNEVNGTVFASEGTKRYRELSSSTGVVPFSRIEAEFKDLDPNMIVQFLKHLQFCVEIDQNARKMIEPDMTLDQKERCFFFPHLVREQAPADVWTLEDRFKDWSGWQVECSNSEHFFSARFLQLLLLRMAFRYALPLSSEEASTDHPAIQRVCKVWKNGIYWENEDLIAALVELPDPCKKVNILVRCQQGNMAHMLLLRSQLVQDVLNLQNEVCKKVPVKELILHPQAVTSHPIDPPNEKVVFASKLATAIANHKPGAVNLALETTPIHELLLYDPYSCDVHCKQEVDQLLARYGLSGNKTSATADSTVFQSKLGSTPTIQELQNLMLHHSKGTLKIIESTASKWNSLAIALDFDVPIIQNIERDTHSKCEDACYEMFTRWLVTQGASWKSLLAALDAINEQVLASDLTKALQ